ncbi:uncharacterized protein [Macrobrachium rosenbergii]|uniref:uncharacterized protein n=1 Tax=Macrobrachium rosenbergii TaxID=79674 RepID=UPI0034D6FF43
MPLASSNTTFLLDTSTGPLVTASRRRQVFDIVHGLSHPSGHLMTNKFVGHGINRDVHQWGRSCISCQASKTPWHTESGSATSSSLIGVWATSLGPFRSREKPPDDHRLFHPLAGGNPHGGSITTGRGPAFLSELWVSLARLMGTTLHSTTAYNPSANSMVETAHHSLGTLHQQEVEGTAALGPAASPHHAEGKW